MNGYRVLCKLRRKRAGLTAQKRAYESLVTNTKRDPELTSHTRSDSRLRLTEKWVVESLSWVKGQGGYDQGASV